VAPDEMPKGIEMEIHRVGILRASSKSQKSLNCNSALANARATNLVTALSEGTVDGLQSPGRSLVWSGWYCQLEEDSPILGAKAAGTETKNQ
jgi:hypothetical protein